MLGRHPRELLLTETCVPITEHIKISAALEVWGPVSTN